MTTYYCLRFATHQFDSGRNETVSKQNFLVDLARIKSQTKNEIINSKFTKFLQVSADRKNGVTSIKYKRPLQTNDSNLDRSIEIGRDLAVIAAIGPLNSKGEANAHSHDGKGINNEDIRIDFSSRVSVEILHLTAHAKFMENFI